MNWGSALSFLDSSVVKTLGGVPATFTPQDGSGDQTINGLIKTPAMEEDFVPGSLQGTSVVRFWVKITDITPAPQNGDVVTLNGVEYAVQVPPDVDSQGGATLKLRAT